MNDERLGFRYGMGPHEKGYKWMIDIIATYNRFRISKETTERGSFE